MGGAYKAALRLHEGLTRLGVQSEILLRTKTDKSNVGIEVFHNRLSATISKAKNVWNLLHADGEITRDVWGTDISRNARVREADVIILHWINSFLTVREFERLAALHKPIIWILHDMWLFTGGCHYDGYCGRYEQGCGDCPLVSKRGDRDISWRNFSDKEAVMKHIPAVVVGPSQWMVDCAGHSGILSGKKIVYLPNMVDAEVFCPIEDKACLRRKYGINGAKRVILFGAADAGTGNKTKGFSFLAEAFGYTACEAMACGTPVVAFAVGGLKEQITHLENGYLAEFHNAKDIAEGIVYCTENRERLGPRARESAMRYSYENVAKAYLELMEEEVQHTAH